MKSRLTQGALLCAVMLGLCLPVGVEAAKPAGLSAASQRWMVLLTLSAEQGRGMQTRSLANGDVLSAGTRLRVGAGGVVQLLGAGDLLLGVAGPAEVELGSSGAPRRVRVHSAAVVQVSGMGGGLRLGDVDAELARDGATLLYARGRIYVRRGTAVIHLPKPKVASPPSIATTAPANGASSMPLRAATPPSTLRLSIGQSLRLDCMLVSRASVPASALAAVSRYGWPRRYRPATKVALKEEVRRVQRWTEERQQSAREMAACGCTEGSGPGRANQSSGPNGALMLEGRSARLRITIRGMPTVRKATP